MRSSWILCTVGAVGVILGTAEKASAQPLLQYNYNRAYSHFVNSRYSYRVLYSSMPGSGSFYVSPFGYQNQFVEPGFIRQRITPFGYERFDAVPGYGGMMMTPFASSSFYVPGFGTGYFVPWQ